MTWFEPMDLDDLPWDPEVSGDAQQFALYGRTWLAHDPAFQQALARAHVSGDRPRCLCTPTGLDMYVARHERYRVQRLPDSGPQHHPSCPSYEPDDACSGLGHLVGGAVRDAGSDRVELRVDFPWVRLQGRAMPPGQPGDKGEVANPPARMSLRAVLHYLFERAGFNRWTPAMAGKRHQGVLHKYLMGAAAGIAVKGTALSERLYVPERFDERRMTEVAARRSEKLAITHPQNGCAPMALVIGDFKACEPGDLVYRLWIRHMPDLPLLLTPQGWQRLVRAYRPLLEAHDADGGRRLRLVVAALVRARRSFTYEIDTACLMLASRDWIPLESLHELPLVEALVAQQRRFFKPLRYDARTAATFANVLLLDAGPSPVALHVLNASLSEQDHALKDGVLQAATAPAWAWSMQKPMPALPPRAVVH